MSSLLNVRPGIKPRFLSQKMAQKLPEKKMPSMAAYATSRSAKESVLQRRTHSTSVRRASYGRGVAFGATDVVDGCVSAAARHALRAQRCVDTPMCKCGCAESEERDCGATEDGGVFERCSIAEKGSVAQHMHVCRIKLG